MSTIVRTHKPRTYTTKDVYKAYAKSLIAANPGYWGKYDKKMPNYRVFREEDGKPIEVISYPRYRRMIETWFYKAQEHVISGEVLVLGNNLGRIAGRRVERNFKNKQVNWQATKELWEKKGERKGLVYHLSEDWVRIGWNKPGKIKNETFYRFTPAEGNNVNDNGFKKAFSQANMENPLLKYKYAFYPYIKDKD